MKKFIPLMILSTISNMKRWLELPCRSTWRAIRLSETATKPNRWRNWLEVILRPTKKRRRKRLKPRKVAMKCLEINPCLPNRWKDQSKKLCLTKLILLCQSCLRAVLWFRLRSNQWQVLQEKKIDQREWSWLMRRAPICQGWTISVKAETTPLTLQRQEIPVQLGWPITEKKTPIQLHEKTKDKKSECIANRGMPTIN